jgi:uncharacterized membrane protein
MNFILGTIAMVAAIMLIGFAKYAITRWESSSWIQRFAGTEIMALTITMLTAFGTALLFAGLASSQSALGYTELAASLGCIALAVVGVMRLFRSTPARAPAATATRRAGA